MAAIEMYDYLNTAVADNNQTLTIPGQVVLNETPVLNQEVHLGDDESEERIQLGSGDPYFLVGIQWPNNTESDIGTIMLFWLDEDYGKGFLYTFYWEHPTDGHTYVVRFAADITRTIRNLDLHGVPNAQLKVVGRVED